MKERVVVAVVCVLAGCSSRPADPPAVAAYSEAAPPANPLKIEASVVVYDWNGTQLMSVCDTRMGRRIYILRAPEALAMFTALDGCE